MIRKLRGGNFDLDLCSSDAVPWPQDPWNEKDKTMEHRCAVKNTSICPYFAGLGDGNELDTVLCSYPVKFTDLDE